MHHSHNFARYPLNTGTSKIRLLNVGQKLKRYFPPTSKRRLLDIWIAVDRYIKTSTRRLLLSRFQRLPTNIGSQKYAMLVDGRWPDIGRRTSTQRWLRDVGPTLVDGRSPNVSQQMFAQHWSTDILPMLVNRHSANVRKGTSAYCWFMDIYLTLIIQLAVA